MKTMSSLALAAASLAMSCIGGFALGRNGPRRSKKSMKQSGRSR